MRVVIKHERLGEPNRYWNGCGWGENRKNAIQYGPGEGKEIMQRINQGGKLGFAELERA